MLKTKRKTLLKDFFLGAIVAFCFIPNSFANTEIPASYSKKIELKDGIYKEILDTSKHPEFFGVYTKYFYKGEEVEFASGSTLLDFLSFNFKLETKEIVGISRGGIKDYVRKKLAPKYNREMQKVRIFRNPENNQIEFEGMAREGRVVDENKLFYLLKKAFESEVKTVAIPFIYTPAEIKVEDEELKKAGIADLLATGESDFSGSSWMRITNIRVGLSQFNGSIFYPGEIYSITDNLGEVSAAMGYKRELVIKGDRTVPEYGGGLCQVSTTAFRGALNAGFEIIERWPHAYAVSYYEPFGTDATIYSPIKDLKFKNNTPGAVLIQTLIDEENQKAYFNYYGTKDKRKVHMIGPFFSNYRNPGPTLYEINPNLKPGEKKVLGSYHVGFDAYWVRELELGSGTTINQSGSNLTSSGEVVVNVQPLFSFFSRYKPTAWFYQIPPATIEIKKE